MAVKIVSKKKLGDSWGRELKGVINYRKITEKAPELLQIFHVEEDQEHFFYTMEAADSVSEQEYRPDTLASRLNRGQLPQDEVFGILSAIFAGIKTIHDAGFAHRDIKPDNILFVKSVPKLGDIGLISALSTTTTQVAGTIDFLPPEVRTAEYAESSNQKSTQKNDLYAFGKVIYCAITGLEPQSWPAIPKALPLTLPFKLFLRLSFRLCDKDPAKRIHSIDELGKELSDIERKLKTGETCQDKAAYQLKRFLLEVRSAGVHLASFLRKHWLLSGIVLMLAVGTSWFVYYEIQAVLARQEAMLQPIDLSKQETKQYTNAELGISMTVPFQWDIVSKETLVKLMEEAKNENEELTEWDRKRIELFLSVYETGADAIYFDYEFSPQDNITILNSPDSQLFFEMNPDETKFILRELMKSELGGDIIFFEVSKTTFKDVPCVYLDYLVDNEKRFNCYVFAWNGHVFNITCTCNKDRYAL